MNTFTIRDLESLTGIKAHTIRVWEQRYSFLKPNRTGTNIRFYSNEELKMILNIALLNKFGFKISHIDKMQADEMQTNIVSLSAAEACHERMVNELITHMIELNMADFEAIVDGYVMSKGIDKAINQLIFPFLERVGILWMTDNINPVQEHLVANLIRQKLIAGIEAIVSHVIVDKTVALFLPEGEYHELGLLYTCYMLKKRGINVLYLGANVPVKDLEFLCRHKHPDFLYTHITCLPGNFNFDSFLLQKNRCVKDVPLIVSGQLAQNQTRKPLPLVQFKRSLAEVLEFISSL